MSGVVSETHYADVRERATSAQSQLTAFGESSTPTTIAVVREPGDTDIEHYCDEWRPVLGMPESVLRSFWNYKAGYRTNSAVTNPVERAYNDANCGQRYWSYLQHTDDAQAAVDDIVGRVESGEDITLVCFEGPSQPCHRHLLLSMIEERLEHNLSATVAAD